MAEHGRRRRPCRGDPLCVPVEADRVHAAELELREQALLGHDHRHGGVLEHESPAVGRKGRIDGHIGAARTHDPEQTDEHVERAIDADRDEHVRADAEVLQEPRESVRPCIELAVRKAVVFVLDGDVVCVGACLCGDQLVGPAGRERAGRVVPLLEHPHTLLGGEEPELPDRALRILDGFGEEHRKA